MNRNHYYIIFLILFLISIVFRWPNLNQPLSMKHEWLTAHSLIVLENWDNRPWDEHQYLLLMTYPNINDQWVRSQGVQLVNQQGDGFYISFPSFSLIFVYGIMKLFSIPCTVMSIQLLNMLMSFIAILLFCEILIHVKIKQNIVCVLGILYLFLPNHLWYFSNTFSWDIFWIYLWICNIYFYQKWVLLNENISFIKCFILALLNIVLIWSEFHGLLYAFSVILIHVFIRPHKKIVSFYIISSIISIIIIIFQFSHMFGFHEYLNIMIDAYLRRTSLKIGLFHLLEKILIFYVKNYGLIFVMIIVLSINLKLKKIRIYYHKYYIYFILFFVPSLIHHLFLLEWTAIHEYSVLKSSFGIYFLFAILIHQVIQSKTISSNILIFGFIALLSISIITYQKEYAYAHHEKYNKLGKSIRKNSSMSEVIFVKKPDESEIPLPVLFYAQRNIQPVQNKKEAINWLKHYQKKRGKLFVLDKQHQLKQIKELVV